jgi:hypothetical protein
MAFHGATSFITFCLVTAKRSRSEVADDRHELLCIQIQSPMFHPVTAELRWELLSAGLWVVRPSEIAGNVRMAGQESWVTGMGLPCRFCVVEAANDDVNVLLLGTRRTGRKGPIAEEIAPSNTAVELSASFGVLIRVNY